MLFSITDRAAGKIKAIATRQGKTGAALRVQVVGGGCSGLSYQFGFAESVTGQDKQFEKEGVKVVIDPKTLIYVAGSELDYEEGLMKSGFRVKNPNAAASCSCGESFTV